VKVHIQNHETSTLLYRAEDIEFTRFVKPQIKRQFNAFLYVVPPTPNPPRASGGWQGQKYEDF